MKQVFLSYHDIHADCIELAKIIKKKYKPEKLILISRGGLIPGSIIANYLGIQDIDVIALKTYQNRKRSSDIKIFKRIKSLKKLVVIDEERPDLIDDIVAEKITVRKAYKLVTIQAPKDIVDPNRHTFYDDLKKYPDILVSEESDEELMEKVMRLDGFKKKTAQMFVPYIDNFKEIWCNNPNRFNNYKAHNYIKKYTFNVAYF